MMVGNVLAAQRLQWQADATSPVAERSSRPFRSQCRPPQRVARRRSQRAKASRRRPPAAGLLRRAHTRDISAFLPAFFARREVPLAAAAGATPQQEGEEKRRRMRREEERATAAEEDSATEFTAVQGAKGIQREDIGERDVVHAYAAQRRSAGLRYSAEQSARRGSAPCPHPLSTRIRVHKGMPKCRHGSYHREHVCSAAREQRV